MASTRNSLASKCFALMGHRSRNVGKALLAVFFIAMGIVLQLYHRWVLSPKANDFGYPLSMAMCARLYLAMAYSVVALAARTTGCQARLYGNTHTYVNERWLVWVPLISFLVAIDAVGMALDTMVYKYLSLTLKQVIDSTVPLVMGVATFAWAYCACRCWRKRETVWDNLNERLEAQDGAELDTQSTRSSESFELLAAKKPAEVDPDYYVRWLKRFSVLAVGVGTAMTVWSATADDGGNSHLVLGIVLDFASVCVAVCSILITSYILAQPAWSRFRLLSTTAWPSAIMMVFAAYIGHGADGFAGPVMRTAAGYALFPACSSLVLAFVGLWLLQNTSPLTYSVLSNAVVVGVVLADVFLLGERVNTVNGLGLGVCGVALFLYGWADSQKETIVVREDSVTQDSSSDLVAEDFEAGVAWSSSSSL